jgi:hypothetical protein
MLFLEKFTKLVTVPEERTESQFTFLKKFVNKPEFVRLFSPDECRYFLHRAPTD